MPKKSLKINQFHGGLNNYRDRRDTPDNALVNASNVMVDIPGKIRMMGRDMPFEQLANTINIDGGVTPGYGLFVFKADHNLNGDATNDGNIFVVYQNGNQFNVLQNGKIYDPDVAVDGLTGGFDPGWSGSLFTSFHYTNERLFVSDGNFDNDGTGATTNNMPYVYEFLDHTLFAGASDDQIDIAAGWYGNPVSYPALTSNIATVIDSDGTFTVSVAGATTNKAIVLTVNNDDAVTGDWENQTIWLGISTLYGDEESKIHYDTSATTTMRETLDQGQGALNLSISLTLLADNGTPTLDKRITGFKIYLMGSNSTTAYSIDKDPALLATADMINKTFTSHEGEEVTWAKDTESGNYRTYNSTKLTIATLPTTTYEMENLYAHDVPTIRAKWKTAATMGNQIFLGNVRTYKDDSVSAANEIAEPDKILRVIPPPLSQRAGIFPSTDFLEVASGDGDEIIKLETFADRLIVLKRKTTYVINISGDIEYIEQEYKFAGIAATYNVIATEFGIVWVNPQGAYLYDGEKLTNLIDGKIDPYISPELTSHGETMPGWANFIGSSGGQLGYLPEEKHLIVFDTPYGNHENADEINIQGNMMVLDLKSGSWTYATDRISPYSRSNIVNGVTKTCLFLGNVSSGTNKMTTTILKSGRPYSDFYQEIVGITNDQVTPEGFNYKLLLKDSFGEFTDLTEDFSWTVDNQATASAGASFADLIVDKIITFYDDEVSDTNIVALPVVNGDNDYSVKVTFAANANESQSPAIFGKEIVWKVSDGYTTPSTSAAGLNFFNAGLGCGIAPIRSWYQKEAMTNHSNDSGNFYASFGGTSGRIDNLINTWGGLETYPYIEVTHEQLVSSNIWKSTLPSLASKNYIYKWLVNKAALYLGKEQQQFFEDNQSVFGPDNESDLLKGLPWGHSLDSLSEYSGTWYPGYFHHNDQGSFKARDELTKRNTMTFPLLSYTGFVFNPLSGRDVLTDTSAPYDESSSWVNGTGADHYHADHLWNTTTAARTNPRLVRYMCNFNYNEKLKDYSEISPNITNGAGYVLPNENNSGAYVSPGLIFTQSWSTDSSELHDKFEELGGNNSGDDDKNGNGFYTNDTGLQSTTEWPNGYFYFGFGANKPNCSIVEGVGTREYEAMGMGLSGTGDSESLSSVWNPELAGTIHRGSNANIYAYHYFIGWKTIFEDHENLLIDIENRPEYFISKDLLEPGENYLFNNFGDLIYTPGEKRSNYDGNGPWLDSPSYRHDQGSKNLYGFSNSFPQADLYSDNIGLGSLGANAISKDYKFNAEHKETRVYGNSIPFNQQSPADALTCEARDNMITRDAVFLEEPETIEHNGIPLTTKFMGSGSSNRSITATRPKAINLSKEDGGLQSLLPMSPSTTDKNWEDTIVFSSGAKNNDGTPDDESNSHIKAPDGNLPSAVSYSSIPYLVIESKENEIVLHYTCDYEFNKQAHKPGNKYDWSLPQSSALNYEMSGMILTSVKIIDVFNNIYREIPGNNDFAEYSDLALPEEDYEGQTYDPIHEMTWGINGYCQLRFAKDSQNATNAAIIDDIYTTSGSVAFWNNPLKSEDNPRHSDDDFYQGEPITTFCPPIVKDTFVDNYDERILTKIGTETNTSLDVEGGGAGVGFQLFSRGDNGERREIILHNSRDIDAEQTNALMANMLITKTGHPHSPTSKSTSDILWTTDNYDDSLDVNTALKDLITGISDNPLGEMPTFVTIHAYNTTNYPTFVNHSIEDENRFIFEAFDKNMDGEIVHISLEKYIAVGDMIYLASSSRRYRVSSVIYDQGNSRTTIGIDGGVHGSSGATLVYDTVNINDTAASADLTCGAIHFKDVAQTTVPSDLFISGGYSGELKVLQFDNSSTFADKVDSPAEFATGGGIFIETKDFTFDNPSSLKNINFIDISMKGSEGGAGPPFNPASIKVTYALNNSGNFDSSPIEGGMIDNTLSTHYLDDPFNFKTLRFTAPNGRSIKNCKSIALRIESEAISGFELNDITIVYREKTL